MREIDSGSAQYTPTKPRHRASTGFSLRAMPNYGRDNISLQAVNQTACLPLREASYHARPVVMSLNIVEVKPGGFPDGDVIVRLEDFPKGSHGR